MLKDVDSAILHRLLDLQEEDTAIRRLVHRKETLPEAQRLAEITENLRELESDLEIATKQHDEVAREQDRVEGEMEILDNKIAKEEQRLFSGAVSNPKELSALQAEIEMLKRQKSGFEDSLLEIMVQRDQASETLERLRSEHSQLQQQVDRLRSTVSETTSEIDTELSAHQRAREEIAPTIPDALLSLYDQLREQKGGVGAAALVEGTCQGCHTTLPAVEVERVRNEGGVQRCDNCRRILVVA
jgi:predicted  nucleic acid-binding Zn-ribbon protein